MKYALLATFLHLLTFASAQAQERDTQNNRYTPIETIITDLNNDTQPDTLSIYMPPVEGDPGQFRKINISMGTAGRNTFTAKDVWDDIDKDFSKQNKNAVKSERIFIFKENKQTFILLFGFAYGSGRDEITLISIRNNKFEPLLDNTIEEPLQFIDLDNDGKSELVCQNPPEIYQRNEKTKADIGTYSPYLVYKCGNVLYLDKKLTETYNKQHYVWAGFKYDESIKVSYPEKGKPQILQ